MSISIQSDFYCKFFFIDFKFVTFNYLVTASHLKSFLEQILTVKGHTSSLFCPQNYMLFISSAVTKIVSVRDIFLSLTLSSLFTIYSFLLRCEIMILGLRLHLIDCTSIYPSEPESIISVSSRFVRKYRVFKGGSALSTLDGS